MSRDALLAGVREAIDLLERLAGDWSLFEQLSPGGSGTAPSRHRARAGARCPLAARKTVEQRFHAPLDIVDGAARILDPIISGINTGEHVWGQFLKDYRPTAW